MQSLLAGCSSGKQGGFGSVKLGFHSQVRYNSIGALWESESLISMCLEMKINETVGDE